MLFCATPTAVTPSNIAVRDFILNPFEMLYSHRCHTLGRMHDTYSNIGAAI